MILIQIKQAIKSLKWSTSSRRMKQYTAKEELVFMMMKVCVSFLIYFVNRKYHTNYCFSSNVKVVKWRKLKWKAQLQSMNQTGDYKILNKNFNKTGGRKTLNTYLWDCHWMGYFNYMSETRASNFWTKNLIKTNRRKTSKIDLRKVHCRDVKWIELA